MKRGEERFRRTYVRWPDVLRAKIESVVSRDIVIETVKQISAVKKKGKEEYDRRFCSRRSSSRKERKKGGGEEQGRVKESAARVVHKGLARVHPLDTRKWSVGGF